MNEEIGNMGRSLDELMERYSTAPLSPSQISDLKRIKEKLREGLEWIGILLEEHENWIPDEVATYEDFLRLTAPFSPFAELEERLRQQQTTSGLANFLGVNQKEESTGIVKYRKIAEAIIEYPRAHPRRITLVVDEWVLTPIKYLDGRNKTMSTINAYSIRVDDLDIPPAASLLHENGLRGYIYTCLVPLSTLQQWTQNFTLMKNLGFIVEDFGSVIGPIEIGDIIFPVKIDGYNLCFKSKNFPQDFPSGYVYEPAWFESGRLRRALNTINEVLSQKGIPAFELITGNRYEVNVYTPSPTD